MLTGRVKLGVEQEWQLPRRTREGRKPGHSGRAAQEEKASSPTLGRRTGGPMDLGSSCSRSVDRMIECSRGRFHKCVLQREPGYRALSSGLIPLLRTLARALLVRWGEHVLSLEEKPGAPRGGEGLQCAVSSPSHGTRPCWGNLVSQAHVMS